MDREDAWSVLSWSLWRHTAIEGGLAQRTFGLGSLIHLHYIATPLGFNAERICLPFFTSLVGWRYMQVFFPRHYKL